MKQKDSLKDSLNYYLEAIDASAWSLTSKYTMELLSLLLLGLVAVSESRSK